MAGLGRPDAAATGGRRVRGGGDAASRTRGGHDRPEITRVEAGRYGATTPIALDPDRSASEAYGMLGVYGHGDRPSHSFVRVDAGGSISDDRHYAEMFVPLDQLLADLDLRT